MSNTSESIATPLVEVAEPTVFLCKADRYDQFVKEVAKAQGRLDRAGADVKIEFDIETLELEKFVKGLTYEIDRQMVPTGIFEPYFRATLKNDSFRFSTGHHTFVATLVAEEAGYTVHTAPGQSLDGWKRPAVDDISCGICNTVRRRINLYIVRDDNTGELIQVGTNCLAPLLGFTPAALWALTWSSEFAAQFGGNEDDDDDKVWGPGGRVDRTVSIDRVLAIAWAVTNGGKNYVSTKAADAYFDRTGGGSSIATTVSRVHSHLGGRPRPYRGDDTDGIAWDAVQAQVEATSDEIVTAIKGSVASLKPGSDYAENMTVILAAESGRVTYRNVGILGSLVAVYAREQDLRVQRQAEAKKVASGFLGEVKERIRDFSITLLTVREFETDFGASTLVVGRTADGHTVKWFASGSHNWEVGQTLNFKAATVKEHLLAGSDTYTKVDTTMITRGAVTD